MAISALSVIAGLLRFQHERKLADRADARSTLAEGALELGRMRGALADASRALGSALEGDAIWPDDVDEELDKLRDAAFALDGALAAIQIRFKATDKAPTELAAALWAARKQMTLYRFARYQPFTDTQGPRDPTADKEQGWRLFQEFMDHKDAYLVAAQKAAGVKL